MSREFVESNEILRVVAGSRSYGLDTSSSDEDEVGIFVESKNHVFGPSPLETVKVADFPDGEKSASGDRDCTYYSVRKFAELAGKGNPSIMCILFSTDALVISGGPGLAFLSKRDLFVSMEALPRFSGYLTSQVKRLNGEKKGHTPSRPDLIEKFGYDTKYAMHIARLAMQGAEFAETGSITLPMRNYQRKVCSDIRDGKFSKSEILSLIEDLQEDFSEACRKSKLPPEVNWNEITDLTSGIHFDWWENE